MPLDLYQTITDKIIAQMDKGTLPWRNPWNTKDTSMKMPLNKTTGKGYRGINIALLWMSAQENHFVTNEWASFKQWADKRESVAKGQKGSMIVYADTFAKEQDDGTIKNVPFLKSSVVFNRCQLKSYEDTQDVKEETCLVEKLDRAELFLENTKAIIEHDGRDRAYYSRATDSIHLPRKECFIGGSPKEATEGYFSVTLHELTHWSGAPHRLNRTVGKKFGDKDYAFEEMVAEIGSAFLCSALEITNDVRPDHATYIENWLQVMKNDKKFIVSAASHAQKACDFLNSLQPVREPVTAENHLSMY